MPYCDQITPSKVDFPHFIDFNDQLNVRPGTTIVMLAVPITNSQWQMAASPTTLGSTIILSRSRNSVVSISNREEAGILSIHFP